MKFRRQHPLGAGYLDASVPSAVQIIATERETEGQPSTAKEKEKENAQPVLMACPGCGGGLTISADMERTCACRFCNAQVFIPDELWKRLHPVKVKRGWYVRFEGANLEQLNAARRLKDQEEERAELARRRPVAVVGDLKKKYGPITVLAVVVGVLIAAGGPLGWYFGRLAGLDVPDGVIFPCVIVGAVLASLGPVAPVLLGARSGPMRASKQAMIALGHRLSLEIDGEHEGSYIGTARGKVQGRDVKIDPSGDSAIEVALDRGWSFYLKTDPRYPHPSDGLHRFTTGDARFDDFFPIRYAKPEIVERLRDPARLAPFHRYIERWGSRVARLEVSGDVEVHILPGGAEAVETKYLLPEDMEPLLDDTLVLAKALDALASG